jgi:hypothetical protein
LLIDPNRLLHVKTDLLRLQRHLLTITAEVEEITNELRVLNTDPECPCLERALHRYKQRYLARKIHKQAISAGALRPQGSLGFIVDNEEEVFGVRADLSALPHLIWTRSQVPPGNRWPDSAAHSHSAPVDSSSSSLASSLASVPVSNTPAAPDPDPLPAAASRHSS